jgi:hypothetical protein
MPGLVALLMADGTASRQLTILSAGTEGEHADEE